MPGLSSHRTKALVLVGLALLLAAGTSTPVGAGRGRSEDAGLQAVRALTERYHSEAVALDDGFTATDACVPEMGYHYINVARLDTTLEPSRPEALLYAPTADGGRRLTGAEWIVLDRDQDLSTDEDRPALFGHVFDGPMPGHGPGMPIHYDLHAYAWVENPNGGFAAWNPAITCP